MRRNTLYLITIALLTGLSFKANAQLTTTRAGNYGNKNYLVNNILLAGSGITASNVTISGIDTSWGFFNGKASDIGMDSGIILTNGTITLADGPNQKTYGDKSNGAFTTYGYINSLNPGGWPNSNKYQDTDLANLINDKVSDTYSCNILQFDFVATSDTIQFQYSFGSNEEPYYVGSKYLDDFGFFLSGPGITGPFSHKAVNLAIVPGTTNTAVYIDSVNCTVHGNYYVCNWPNSTGCSTCPGNIASTTVGYNGFTTVLTAKAVVQCGKNYHIKLGVANIGNGYFDSGVFLKAGSFSPGSGVMTVSPTASTICTNDSVILTAKGASSYSWSPATGLNNTTGDTVIAKPASTTTYRVVGNQLVGCNDTTYITVTVNQPPSVSVAPITICSGTSDSLKATGASSYTWLASTGLSATTGAGVVANPTTTTTYTVVGSTIGCTATSTQNVTVTVNPIPTITITPSRDSLCRGSNVSLLASGATTYTWSPAGSLTCGTCSNPTANPIITTTYKVVGDSNGCKDSTNITITVIATPVTATVTATPDSICNGSSSTLSVVSSGFTTYVWSTGSTASSISVTPNANTYYYVIAQNKCGSDSVGQTITVIQPANPHITPSTDTICPGATYVLTASGGTSYVWTPSTGLNSKTANPVVVTNMNNITTYTVTATNNGMCPGSSSFTINLKQPPPIKIVASDSVCQGSSITLTAVGTGPYTWSNQSTSSSITVQASKDTTYYVTVTNGCIDSAFHTITVVTPTPVNVCCDTIILPGGVAYITATGANSYVWSPTSTLSCDTCITTKAIPSITTTYTVTGTNKYGCQSSDTVTVAIECHDFDVPNVFTPNGDGQNDVFLIKAFSVESYDIQIFNRWGEQVFQSSSPNVPWDGKDNNGLMVADGVYYYIIKSKCGGANYNHHGFVQVIK